MKLDLTNPTQVRNAELRRTGLQSRITLALDEIEVYEDEINEITAALTSTTWVRLPRFAR